MATTEEAPPGLVLPEYGPTGPELIRRRFGPRARRALAVGGRGRRARPRGADRDPVRRRPDDARAPLRAGLHPAAPAPGRSAASQPASGELVRLRSRRGALEITVTVRRAHAAGLPRQRQRVPARLRRSPRARARRRAARLHPAHRRQGARQRRARLPDPLPRRGRSDRPHDRHRHPRRAGGRPPRRRRPPLPPDQPAAAARRAPSATSSRRRARRSAPSASASTGRSVRAHCRFMGESRR